MAIMLAANRDRMQQAAQDIARKRQEERMSLTTVDGCPSELRKWWLYFKKGKKREGGKLLLL